MATATVVISDREIESNFERLRKEAAELQRRLDGDNAKLTAARAELQRLVEQIASGSAEAGVLQRVKTEMETLEIRIGGYKGQLATNRTSTEQLQDEIRRRQTAAARDARQKEYAELVKQGQAAANSLFGKLLRLETEDLLALDAIRRKLGSEFLDLGGDVAALRLREMLVKTSGPNEKLRDPNVHLATLFDQGWELASNGPRVKNSVGAFESTPGGELVLTVLSLRPPKK
jgi:chaperonin cofactor prefoldin